MSGRYSSCEEREQTPSGGLKECADCLELKDLSEFGKESSRRDGLCPRCRACHAKRSAANRARHRARWAAEEPYSNPALRWCPDCAQNLSRSEFSKDPTSHDGLVGVCRACATAREAARRERNRARWLTPGADPRADPSPRRCGSCRQDRPRSDFSTNPSNRDGLQRFCRGCARAHDDTREARKRAQFVEHVDRDVAWELAGGICYLCHRPCNPARWDLDHVDPIVNGGEHSYFNTAPTHPSCNYSKGGTPWPDVSFDPAL